MGACGVAHLGFVECRLDPVSRSAGAGEAALAHFPQTAGCASNVSVRRHDLRRALGNHPIFDSNAVHGGLN